MRFHLALALTMLLPGSILAGDLVLTGPMTSPLPVHGAFSRTGPSGSMVSSSATSAGFGAGQNFSIRSPRLDIRAQGLSLRGQGVPPSMTPRFRRHRSGDVVKSAVAQAIESSLQEQGQHLRTRGHRSGMRSRVVARRVKVGGIGATSSTYRFPLAD